MQFNYNTANNSLLGYQSSMYPTVNEMQPAPSSIPKASAYQKTSAGKAEKPKRKQVKNACVNCQKACKKCDDGRPCQRCIKLGLTATCTNSARKERKKGVKRGPYKKRQRQSQEIQVVYSTDEWQLKHSRKNSDQLSLPYSYDDSPIMSTGSVAWAPTANNDDGSFISKPILDPSYTQPIPATTPPLVQSSSPLSSTQSDDIYYTAPMSASPFATTSFQEGWWDDQLLQQQTPAMMPIQNEMPSMMYPTDNIPLCHMPVSNPAPVAPVPSSTYMYHSMMVQPIYQQQQQQQQPHMMYNTKPVDPNAAFWFDQQPSMAPQHHGMWQSFMNPTNRFV
ncbi:hypothetical protein DFQ28_010758 [Apophysomyces sp. BC1034]|nr:hypothetical protein DFQ29_008136 [Apophysomyces sp. BC1021]KAG0173937.1 hypothetical protein DFQ30_006569 [Apophysomyces sp. BC1015]KAG0184666.1 hypothetical protein DFQ28_010758 [Apophysomyces sp. BC1034]